MRITQSGSRQVRGFQSALWRNLKVEKIKDIKPKTNPTEFAEQRFKCPSVVHGQVGNASDVLVGDAANVLEQLPELTRQAQLEEAIRRFAQQCQVINAVVHNQTDQQVGNLLMRN